MATVLHLTLKREWFDAIVAGTKREEYRALKPYWKTRLGAHVGQPPWTEIHFKNGYGPRVPFMRVQCLGLRIGPNPAGKNRFILSLGPILELKNHPTTL